MRFGSCRVWGCRYDRKCKRRQMPPTQKSYLIPVVLCLLLQQGKSQLFVVDIQHYGTEEGLPHREVLSLHQDRQGFIWAGTAGGLSRFDGYGFRNFNGRTDSISTEEIWGIQEGKDGFFWLLPFPPYKDIELWHPGTRRRSSLKEKYAPLESIPQAEPHDWYFFPDGAVLTAGTSFENGWTEFREDKGFLPIRQDIFRQFQLIRHGSSVWAVADSSRLVQLDRAGRLLRQHAQGNGMWSARLNTTRQTNSRFLVRDQAGTWMRNDKGEIRRLPGDYTAPTLLPGADVPAIGEDLILDNNHIHRLDGSLVADLEPGWKSIGNLFFRCALFDDQGNLWLGNNFGLTRVVIRKNKFERYFWQHPEKIKSGLAVRGMLPLEDKLLVCLESKGLFRLDTNTGHPDKIQLNALGNNHYALHRLTDGRLAVGHQNHLSILDAQMTPLKIFEVPATVLAIYQNMPDMLWLGTVQGLYFLDLRTRELRLPRPDEAFGALASTQVYSIRELQNGKAGIATAQGFFVLKSDGTPLARYSRDGQGPFRLPHHDILHFHEEENGSIWLGSHGGGLMFLPPGLANPGMTQEQDDGTTSAGLLQFTTAEGLSNNVIYAVYPDRLGNLWLSSDNGIMCFDKKTGAVRTFLENDGISYREFNKISHCQDAAGKLYFGGLNGITAFHPAQLTESGDSTEFPLVVSSFRKLSANSGLMKDLSGDLFEEKRIVLEPGDRLVELELALLNYSQAKDSRYAWKIGGMGQDWNLTKSRTLNFGRLPYGEHQLHIRAADAQGRWSVKEIILPIVVLRPIYLQPWFLTLCALLLAATVLLYIGHRTRQLMQQRTALQEEVARRTHTIAQQAEELRSLDNLKSRFFANVSHELRTPLSLLAGPADSLLRQPHWPEKERRMLGFMRRNITHLLNLVNEILDLAKLESGHIAPEEKPVRLLSFLKPLVAQFSAAEEGISVRLHFDYRADKDLQLWLDTGKTEKIIHNFLANALKFTPAGKCVRLVVEEDPEHLVVEVRDEGPGIHPEDLPKVFDRFYQSKRDGLGPRGGTGIGLSLCRELAQLLGAKVWATSEYGKGSAFFFRFPKKPVSPDNHLPDSIAEKPAESASALGNTALSPGGKTGNAASPPANRERILIVEDHADLREYILMTMEDHYQVCSARNGLEAWQLLEKDPPPDLVISDLMMPEMDGFALLEKMKGSDKLRHLPFVMLTARADLQVRLKALRTGVDDYLTKPFSDEELLVRVEKLLENQRERAAARRLWEADEPGPQDAELPQMSAADAAWLEELETIMKRNISNPNFVIEEAAAEMHLSDRHLTRRLKLLTGLTPNNFLREMRLQQAKLLLLDGRFQTLKEVSFSVGFQQPQYFARIFKERFGVGPSEYL